MERGHYYQALLRELPKAELARSVVRRASRTARRALWRPASPSGRALGWALGARSPPDFVRRLLAPRVGWSDVGRRPSVLRALARCPGAGDRALARARDARERTFYLFGHRVSFGEGRPIDWAFDASSGIRYPPLEARQVEPPAPGMDPKYPWALGRLDCLVALGQGYWVAEPPERGVFAHAFVELVREFVQENPVGVGIQWACPMEVSLRAVNLAQALLMFRDVEAVRDPEWLALLARALVEHLGFVEAHLEDDGPVPNNHLIADLLGLWTVGLLFPELPGARRQAALARERLFGELLRQVHPDGFSFEGSVPYHRLVLEMAALAYLMGSRSGVRMAEQFRERLLGMFRVADAYVSDAGRAPQLGDNDSGRALPLMDRDSLDHGYLAPFGAALLASRELKHDGDELPDEAAWLLGWEGLTAFERLVPTPRPRGFSSRPGGLHVLKAPGVALTVSAGRSGQGGVGGHSHNDKLSFELHLLGVPVVVDPGTGSYSGDPILRQLLRSTQVHNTLQVDEREQSPLLFSRPFALLDASRAQLEAFCDGPGLARVTGSHLGFGRPGEPLRVERTFLLDAEAGTLVVEDWVEGRGQHRLRNRLQLWDDQVRLRGVTEGERRRGLRAPRGPMAFGGLGAELGPPWAPRALVLFDAEARPRLEPSVVSWGYGQVREAPALVWEGPRELPARDGCVVLFLNGWVGGSSDAADGDPAL